ncbi:MULTISPECIES: HEAT repeat domain-containing protein [Corallococcus]|uniref:HEAT repeat domain-containing protein n=1 Tax=Corallococcus TaxID=83461 RepID=UPI0011C3C972|nr:MULTISPECIES: HEAT repeat domain-containing protein [Corallococcus]
MSSVPSLVWSSRENIRAQLLSLLETVPLESVALRDRVVRLLGVFGGPELTTLLLERFFDEREGFSTRERALHALVKQGAPLSGPDITRIIDVSPLMCPCCSPSTEEVLTLARTEDAWEAAEAALLKHSPQMRAHVLASTEHTRLSPRLVEWLYSRWFLHDRHPLAEGDDWDPRANLQVAVAHRERPEARMLLDAWGRDMAAEVLGQLSRAEPRLQQSVDALLLLPLPDLLASFGQEALLRLIHRIVRAESVAQKVAHGIQPSPPGSFRALELLVEWREARPLLRSLLCDFDIADGVRHSLLNHLLDHDRAMAVRWALAAMRYPDNAALVRFVLQGAARQPAPGDRPLFLAALQGEDAETQVFALEGLFALGESGAGWRDRLTSLVHSSDERMRLRAAACLIREGQREWLPMLRQAALEPPERGLRAEAVRWLGQVDAEASRPVLEQVLAGAATSSPRNHASGADEAAWALSRLGTAEDRSALLDAALQGFCSPGIHRELEYHLARQEGRPAQDVLPPWSR